MDRPCARYGFCKLGSKSALLVEIWHDITGDKRDSDGQGRVVRTNIEGRSDRYDCSCSQLLGL